MLTLKSVYFKKEIFSKIKEIKQELRFLKFYLFLINNNYRTIRKVNKEKNDHNFNARISSLRKSVLKN